MIKNVLNKFLTKLSNYRVIKENIFKELNQNLMDEPFIDKEFLEISNKLNIIYPEDIVHETNFTAYSITKNVINQNLKGCFVECGVFKGQKVAFFLETLKSMGIYDRDVFLVDTFEGMTEPSKDDIQMISDRKMFKGDKLAILENVKQNIYKTGYPKDKIHFVKMDVRSEEDLKKNINREIAVLRLDTDFFDSTWSILNSLYNNVVVGGYLIHDDYGHWKGHYEACKKFYSTNKIRPLLIRTCRKERVEIKI